MLFRNEMCLVYDLFKLTCIRLFPCDNDPNHNCKAVHIRFLSRGRMYTLQVLGSHVAQCAGSSRPSWSPLLTLPAKLLLCELAPCLAGSQTKVCNLTEAETKALSLPSLCWQKYGWFSCPDERRTLMWKSLSTKMFSGLRSLCMMCLSERYTIASRISKMILPLMQSGTGT